MTINVNQNKDIDDSFSVSFGKKDVRSSNRRVKSVKAVAFFAWSVVADCFAAVIGLAIAATYMLNYLTVQKNIQADFLKPILQHEFREAFQGNTSEIQNITLNWHPKNDFSLKVSDVVILDQHEKTLADVDHLSVSVDKANILKGRFAPTQISISGGTITWKRDVSGSVLVGVGTPDTVGEFLFIKPMHQMRTSADEASLLESIEIHRSNIYVIDEVSDLDFKITDNKTQIYKKYSHYMVLSEGGLRDDGESGKYAFEGFFDSSLSYTDLSLSFKALNPSLLAPTQGRFKELSDFDVPLSGKLDLKTEGIDVEVLDLDLSAAEGRYDVFGLKDELSNLRIKAAYDSAASLVKLQHIEVASSKLGFTGNGRLSNIGSAADFFQSDEPKFAFVLDQVFLNAGDKFERPFDMDLLKVSGQWKSPSKSFDISEFELKKKAYEVLGHAEIGLDNRGKITFLKGELESSGVLSTNELRHYWPFGVSKRARQWYEKSVKSGNINELWSEFDVVKEHFDGAPVPVDGLNVIFEVENPLVDYHEALPVYKAERASGVISGNRLEITATGGGIETIQVDTAQVFIPQLRPPGSDFDLNLSGNGEIREILDIIDREPFRLAEQNNLKPDSFTGSTNFTLKLTRPLAKLATLDDVKYEISAQLDEFETVEPYGLAKLTQGKLNLQMNEDEMLLNGPVNYGPWASEILIESDPLATKRQIKGNIDQSVLDKLGLGARQYFSGDIDLTIESTATEGTGGFGNISANLQNAELTFGPYVKPKGEPAEFTADVVYDQTTAVYNFSELELSAKGLSITGALSVKNNGQLVALELKKIDIEGIGDISLSVKPNINLSAFEIELSGKQLDLSHWFKSDLFTKSDSFKIPLTLTGEVEQLSLTPELIYQNASVSLFHSGRQFETAKAQAVSERGELFLRLDPGEEGNRLLEFTTPDAGLFISALSRTTRIKKGRLTIAGKLMPSMEGGGFSGQISMQDFKVEDLPFFAQLLSLASLRGLFDNLSGSGIHFDDMVAPVQFREGTIILSDGRMSGDSMGLTADGMISFRKNQIDLDGVIVPAYAANSLLGDIPVLGDIVVGKKGEGIIGLNYKMKGPFEQTNVSVNPLSALTPGFLRGIFKSKKDAPTFDQSENQNDVPE